ncbi:MAG: phosphoadenylyl-sulfate reductase [Bacteroidota bacterium]
MQITRINEINEEFRNASPEKLLQYFLAAFKNKIALGSSLSAEDQVITHFIANIDPTTAIFTLDTGRVFPETYATIERTKMQYDINISIYFPNNKAVEEMVNQKGVNLFYESVENRKQCCSIRKMEPLHRAFKGLEVWICGLRKEQAITREEMQMVEWDEQNQLIKINPLINWTEKEVWDFIRKNGIPYNKLHDQGFPSIGCQPCTRAVKPGEDVRSGRWWWENPETKECGLHSKH